MLRTFDKICVYPNLTRTSLSVIAVLDLFRQRRHIIGALFIVRCHYAILISRLELHDKVRTLRSAS